MIGTDPDCDIVLDDDYVSKHHARVWQDDTGQVWVEDLGSTNGTYALGVIRGKVTGPTRIQPPCTIRVGHTDLPWRR